MTAGRVLIGTSSWTDPTLVKDGNFYPRGTKSAEARLKFYASQFPLVEVDSTYYYPPSEKNSVLWIERTPAEFTFNIKAYSLLTNHPTRTETWMSERNREESLAFLEERKLPFVCVDMPQGFPSSVPPIAAATADDLAVVRFHGRDAKAWTTKSETAADRFKYDYSKEELQ